MVIYQLYTLCATVQYISTLSWNCCVRQQCLTRAIRSCFKTDVCKLFSYFSWKKKALHLMSSSFIWRGTVIGFCDPDSLKSRSSAEIFRPNVSEQPFALIATQRRPKSGMGAHGFKSFCLWCATPLAPRLQAGISCWRTLLRLALRLASSTGWVEHNRTTRRRAGR